MAEAIQTGTNQVVNKTQDRNVVQGPPSFPMNCAIDNFVETVVGFQCIGRASRVSYSRISQALFTRVYEESDKNLSVFIQMTGSSYEGMPADVCGDTDLMIQYRGDPPCFPVTPCNAQTMSKEGGFFVTETDNQHPAFLVVRVPPGLKYADDIEKTFEDLPSNYNSPLDWKCVGSEKFTLRFLAEDEEIHGPAATEHIQFAETLMADVDYVPCLSSPSWPDSANDFVTRMKPTGWPSEEQVARIKEDGCLIVPVGHPQCTHRDIQWRWSFSLAEKELLHSMSFEMAACMYALKTIKKKHWVQPDGEPTVFCSYFIKTACLWVHESEAPSTSVLDTCRKVITWLEKCYNNGEIPHYFVPMQNLIGHLPSNLLKTAQIWLQNIHDNLACVLVGSMNLAPDICEVLVPITDMLCKSTHVNDMTAYQDLLTQCYTIDEMIPLLEKATSALSKYSPLWTYQFHYQLCIHTSVVFTDLAHGIEECFEKGAPLERVLTLPERSVLPIIDSITSFVTEGERLMFQVSLHRLLGNTYSELTSFVLNDVEDTAEYAEFLSKPLHYFSLGAEMVYPDGWSDKGLGGLVLTAKHYYLRNDWENLERILIKLEPLLLEARAVKETLNCLSYITIEVDHAMSISAWAADEEISNEVLETIKDDYLLNPVVLAHYFKAKLYLRRKDTDRAAEVINVMKECLPLLKDDAIKTSTGDLIRLLSNKVEQPLPRKNFSYCNLI